MPLRLPDSVINVTPAGAGSYRVSIAVARPADEGPTIALLVGWLWFAARRADLHLDGEAADAAVTPERCESAVRRVAQRLGLAEDDAATLSASGRLERFGAGEALTHAGDVASGLRFIIDGNVSLTAQVEGRRLDYHSLSTPEAVGLGVHTQLPEADTARATTSVTTLTIPREVVTELIGCYARLAVELGQVTDHRRQLLATARERAASAVGVTG